MDSRLWGRLPQDILLAILSWLPLRTLGEAQSGVQELVVNVGLPRVHEIPCSPCSAFGYNNPDFILSRLTVYVHQSFVTVTLVCNRHPSATYSCSKTHGVEWFGSRKPQSCCYDPAVRMYCISFNLNDVLVVPGRLGRGPVNRSGKFVDRLTSMLTGPGYVRIG